MFEVHTPIKRSIRSCFAAYGFLHREVGWVVVLRAAAWVVLAVRMVPCTPWCRVLLEKLTGLQLVKKFPAFHGTRRFINALTSVRYLSQSWTSIIQSIYPHPTSWRSILILSTHLRLGLPSGLFPSGFPPKTLYTPSPHPYAPHAQPISFFSILSPAQYWVRSRVHLAPRFAVKTTTHPKSRCRTAPSAPYTRPRQRSS